MSNDAPPPPPPGSGYQPPPGPPPQQQSGGKGMAVAALVFGILALLSCWTVFGGIIFGLLALVLGLIASGKAKRGEAGGRGMAITGVALGVLGALISIGLIVITAVFLNSDSAKNLRDCLQQAGDDQSAIQQCQQDFQRDLTG